VRQAFTAAIVSMLISAMPRSTAAFNVFAHVCMMTMRTGLDEMNCMTGSGVFTARLSLRYQVKALGRTRFALKTGPWPT